MKCLRPRLRWASYAQDGRDRRPRRRCRLHRTRTAAPDERGAEGPSETPRSAENVVALSSTGRRAADEGPARGEVRGVSGIRGSPSPSPSFPAFLVEHPHPSPREAALARARASQSGGAHSVIAVVARSLPFGRGPVGRVTCRCAASRSGTDLSVRGPAAEVGVAA